MKMKSNQKLIKSRIEGLGYKEGSYNYGIDKLSTSELSKILTNIEWADTDVDVTINKKEYVVEIVKCDNAIDLYLLSKLEYIGRYGNERYEKD